MLLITGATGFIGGHLLELLAASGEPVRCLVRRKAPGAGLTFPPGWSPELAPGDLATGEGLERALNGVTAVIHLAGVTKALRDSDYYDGNVSATATLLRAVRGRQVRLVHVSSLAAVGPGECLTEDAEPHPVSRYGRSKSEAETLVRAEMPEAVIVRPPVVYGPRDTDVFQILKSVSKGISSEIAGGERWFSHVYVKDLAAGLLAAARHPRATGRTYYLTYPKPATWSELSSTAARIMNVRPPRVLRMPYSLAYAVGACAEAWSRIVGKPGIISRDKILEARCASWTCDGRRASTELGFEPSTPLAAGLAESIAWYREAGWLTRLP